MTDTTAPDTSAKATAKDAQKGRLIAFKNLQASGDNKRPAFEGEITLPDDGGKRPIALWIKNAKDGSIVLTGTMGADAKAQIQQMAERGSDAETPNALQLAQKGGKSLDLKPNTLILFANKAKTAEASSKPDYWGYAADGNTPIPLRLAAWAKIDKNGNAYIAGNAEPDKAPEQAREKQKTKSRDR